MAAFKEAKIEERGAIKPLEINIEEKQYHGFGGLIVLIIEAIGKWCELEKLREQRQLVEERLEEIKGWKPSGFDIYD